MKIQKLELSDIISPQIVQVLSSSQLRRAILHFVGEKGLEHLENNARMYFERCELSGLCLEPDIREIKNRLQLSGSIYVPTERISNTPIIGAKLDGGYIIIDR